MDAQGCSELAVLRAQAREARDAARDEPSAGEAPTTQDTAPPLMPPVHEKRQLELQFPGSVWSPPIEMEAVGTHALLDLEPSGQSPGGYVPALVGSGVRPGCYQLGLSIHSCPGQFGRSKMLTIAHRVVLCNELPHPIGYKQYDSALVGSLLRPGERAPFHWQQANLARLLSICLVRSGLEKAEALASCDWSCAFPIHEVGDITIVSRMSNSREKAFISVDVQASRSVLRSVAGHRAHCRWHALPTAERRYAAILPGSS